MYDIGSAFHITSGGDVEIGGRWLDVSRISADLLIPEDRRLYALWDDVNAAIASPFLVGAFRDQGQRKGHVEIWVELMSGRKEKKRWGDRPVGGEIPLPKEIREYMLNLKEAGVPVYAEDGVDRVFVTAQVESAQQALKFAEIMRQGLEGSGLGHNVIVVW